MKQRLDAIDLSFGERANRLLSVNSTLFHWNDLKYKKLDLAAHPDQDRIIIENLWLR
jgi:glucose-6-phosphate 1-dehydrogenase